MPSVKRAPQESLVAEHNAESVRHLHYLVDDVWRRKYPAGFTMKHQIRGQYSVTIEKKSAAVIVLPGFPHHTVNSRILMVDRAGPALGLRVDRPIAEKKKLL